jgi:hypothetical protein
MTAKWLATSWFFWRTLYPDKRQARFPLTDWVDNVQEVTLSIIVQVTGILPEGFPVFTEGQYQACVSGRFHNFLAPKLFFLF